MGEQVAEDSSTHLSGTWSGPSGLVQLWDVVQTFSGRIWCVVKSVYPEGQCHSCHQASEAQKRLSVLGGPLRSVAGP